MRTNVDIDGVHSFCDNINNNNDKPKKKNVSWFLVGLVLGFLIVTVVVWPVFNRKTGMFDAETGLQDTFDIGSPVGNESEPYFYWYAPSNSFGIGSIKTLNTGYFENWTAQYFNVSLKASPDNITWHNASEGLTSVWNWTHDDNGSRAKITWVINTSEAPQELYYKLIVGIDVRCKNFINGTVNDSQVQFDFPVENDTYSLFLNWSDIIPLIQDGKITVSRGVKTIENNSYFYAVLQTVNKLPVDFYFEIDPLFGETETGSSYTAMGLRIYGTSYLCPTSGTIDNISVGMAPRLETHSISCGIWNNATNVLVGYTEERNLTGEIGWYDFDVIGSVDVIGGTEYILGLWTNTTTGNLRFYRDTGTQTSYRDTETYDYPNFPNSYSKDTTYNSRNYSIYCNYTESAVNTAPTIELHSPGNASTGITLNPTCKVWSNDSDAVDTLNVTFYENSTGITVGRQTNSSVASGTLCEWNSTGFFNTENTEYWWNVSVDDGTVNRSYQFSFTTSSNETWQNIDFSINGTCTNTTTWNELDSSINGTCTNTTSWREISSNINGTCTNTTVWTEIDSMINGSCTNISADIWQTIDYSINGTCTNTTIGIVWYHSSKNNAYYKLENDTNFNPIVLNEFYVQFNQSRFNGTSPNRINISHMFMITNITTADLNDRLMEFWVNNTVGNVFWNISGFNNSENYTINRNGSFKETITSNNSGWLFWNETLDGNQRYEIFYNHTIPGETWNMIDSNINGTCTNITLVFITITSPYPNDNSFNAPLQPTIYATINSTTGLTMNVSWYWGATEGNEDTFIGSDINFTNGTQTELFFEANGRATTYYWRAMATDGTNYKNKTSSFTTEGYPGGGVSTPDNGAGLGLLGGVLGGLIGAMLFVKYMRRRRSYG